MKVLVAAIFTLAVVKAAPSGHLGGAIVSGPSGIVTSHGAIGPVGLGHVGVLAAPIGLGLGHGLGLGLGHDLGLGLGLGAITAGGGHVSVSGHGASIVGPGTAPIAVVGPSGKIAADGLWGPTAHVGGGWGHGGWGHGW